MGHIVGIQWGSLERVIPYKNLDFLGTNLPLEPVVDGEREAGNDVGSFRSNRKWHRLGGRGFPTHHFLQLLPSSSHLSCHYNKELKLNLTMVLQFLPSTHRPVYSLTSNQRNSNPFHIGSSLSIEQQQKLSYSVFRSIHSQISISNVKNKICPGWILV